MTRWEQIRRRAATPVPELELPARDGEAVQLRRRAPGVARPARERQRSFLRPLPLLGVVLVLIAVAGYLAVYERAGHRTAVLVAARDLPAGSVLRAGDLRLGKLSGDSRTMTGLLSASKRDRIVGRTLHSGLARGTPLAQAALAPAGASPPAFTLVVPALHALGDGLQPGDRVTVLATFEPTSGRAQTRALARGLVVLTVGQPPTGLDKASTTIAVTVALPNPSLASALALANAEAKIDLLREGTRGTAPIPPVGESEGG